VIGRVYGLLSEKDLEFDSPHFTLLQFLKLLARTFVLL